MNSTAGTSSQASPAPSSLPVPNLRPARFEDYPRIQRLEAEHHLLTLSYQDWRAIWLDNPLHAQLGDRWPIGWVLEDHAGQIVGSLANIPSRYVLGGRPLIAATGRGWVVAPEYRGVALWLMSEYFSQEGVDLFINTTVNSMAVDPFSAFGSARVPLGEWESAAFWVTRAVGFAKTALRIKHAPAPGLLAWPAGAALKMKDLLTNKPLPGGSPADLAAADGFDARFDAFWNELLRLYPDKLLGCRDAASLAWHFAGPLRARQCWIMTASRNGLMRAYAVFKRQDHPPSGLVRMRLVDYQTLLPDQDLLSGMLRLALQRCAAEGIYSLEHVGCGLPKMRVFDDHAPYRRKLPAWPFYYMAPDPQINTALQKPDTWDPSTFDGDASL